MIKFVVNQWFLSAPNKTDSHDLTEMLLKVVLTTYNPPYLNIQENYSQV
jgi:hypothetical protein